MTENNPPFKPFGFTIPISSAGRCIWRPGLKKFVIDELDAGELTVQQVKQEVQVARSLIYKWRVKHSVEDEAERSITPFAQVRIADAPIGN